MRSTAARDSAGALLLERAQEVRTIERALDRAKAGTGSFVVLDGPAGIGKSTLLAAVVPLAAARGMVVLRARPGQVERDVPYATVRQLLEPVLHRSTGPARARLLSGSARHALPAFGPGHEATSGGDPFTVLNGLYWLIANITEEQPLLLVVDDAHWADPASLRMFEHLARRITDLAVVVTLAVRTGEPDEPPGLDVLRLEADVVHPQPLSRGAVSELLAASLGGAAPAELVERCHRATAGNPFLLHELVRALRARGAGADVDPTAVDEAAPDNVARSVLARVARFGEDAIALARAVAILGAAPHLRHAAQLADLTLDRARLTCDRLRGAGILAPGHPIEFVHPLVRAAIESDLPDESRSAAHRRAAEILAAAGARATQVASHLLACSPSGDEWVVARLDEAATEAAGAGAYSSACAFLGRALQEPPLDDRGLRYALGRALTHSDPGSAPGILVGLADQVTDPDVRLQVLRSAAVAYLDVGDIAESLRRSEEALDLVPAADEQLRLVLEAQLYFFATAKRGWSADRSARIHSVTRGLTGRDDAERLAQQALGLDLFLRIAPVNDVIRHCLAFPVGAWEFRGIRSFLPIAAGKILAASGGWDEARRSVGTLLELSLTHGWLTSVSYAYGLLGELDRASGRLYDAEAHGRTAWEVATAFAPASLFGWMAFTNLVATLLARGDVDGAEELTEGVDLSIGPAEVPIIPFPVEIRARLRAARGDVAGALDDWLRLGRDCEGLGMVNPALAPWRQEAARLLAAAGRAAEAKEMVDVAEERARRFGAPHVLASVCRAKAAVEPESRMEHLRSSVELLRTSGPPHELGQSLFELGAALRRDGARRAARDQLHEALDLARTTGAGGLEIRVLEDLASTGTRARRGPRHGVAALTASERRVARLVVAGLSNREIAERLFVTRRTVETHLTHVYEKLGIRSRDELDGAMGAAGTV